MILNNNSSDNSDSSESSESSDSIDSSDSSQAKGPVHLEDRLYPLEQVNSAHMQ